MFLFREYNECPYLLDDNALLLCKCIATTALKMPRNKADENTI